MEIKEALASLDPTIDDLWTDAGLPRVDAVGAVLGYEVTRSDITDADPMFTRSSMDVVPDAVEPAPSAEIQPESEPEPAPEPIIHPAPEPAKMTDAQASTMVDILDDVVGMDAATVFADLGLCIRASTEFNRQVAILSARREAITQKISDVGRRSALVDNALNRLGGNDNTQSNIKNYLARQKEAREKRAKQTQKFIDAGTTVKDVAEALQGASKLDQAMKARKKQVPAYVSTVSDRRQLPGG